MSPHIQDSTFIRYSTIAIRAGCAIAFNNEAVSFCFFVKSSAFVVPMLYLYIAILRYNFIDSAKDVLQGLSEDVAQGPVEGVLQDSAKGALQGLSEGVLQDSTKGALQGLSEGVLQDSTKGVLQAPAEGRYAKRPCEAPFAEPCLHLCKYTP